MIARMLIAVTLTAAALTAAAQVPSAEKQRMIDLGIEHGDRARALRAFQDGSERR